MKGIIMGNKDNVILNSKDEQVGYYADLVAAIKYGVELYLKDNDFENAGTGIEVLNDLAEYSDYGELLVVSDNNGMGYTVRKYIDTISQ